MLVIECKDSSASLFVRRVGKGKFEEVNLHEGKNVLELEEVEELIIRDVDKVEVHDLDELRKIKLYGNICDDEEAMRELAKGLKDRNGMAWGSVVTQNQDIRRVVEDDFIQKDWYFGSNIEVDEEKQPQFAHMNVIDIWESAEYGEGRTYAVADTEVGDNEFTDDRCITSSNYLGKFNFCKREPEFIGTHHYHGLGVLSMIAMNGNVNNLYGVAPNAKFYMFKIGTKEGSATYEDYYRCINKARELELDVMNLSFGSSLRFAEDDDIKEKDKDVCEDFADMNGCLVCASGNEGNNIYRDTDVLSMKFGVQYPNCGSWSMCIGAIRQDERLSDFSSCSYGLDFLALGSNSNPSETSLIVRYNKDEKDKIRFTYTAGTSFSSPLMSGCVLLMKNLFYKKYKREATQEELVEYMSKRTRDIGLESWQQGYGVFDFMAYNENPKKVIKLK